MNTVRVISELEIRAPFSSLFPVEPRMLDALTESMATHGYDPSKPIDVWGDTVVDGHTRVQAALEAGLDRVPVYVHDFADEDAALEYAIRNQRDRRNLPAAELGGYVARALVAVEQRRGGRPKTVPTDTVSPQSASDMADMLGVSERTVKRARAVLAQPEDDPARQALLAGERSVDGAYRETQERRRLSPDLLEVSPYQCPACGAAFDAEVWHCPRCDHHWLLADRECKNCRSAGSSATSNRGAARTIPTPRPPTYTVPVWTALPPAAHQQILRDAPTLDATFNRTNDNVEWALWTWNPVTGCDHGCGYCYARDIANRFYTHLPEGERFAPVFYPSRMHAPRRMQVPAAAAANIGEKNVFVCSMADLFGKWVPQAWIDAVFAEVERASAWNFLFLTKFPQRLAELRWPANAWVGTTVDTQARVANAERSFAGVQAGVKWLSCEPLLERLTFSSLEMFDWVVIGGASASTQTAEFQPPWEWVEHLLRQARAAGCKVYMKPNLKTRPREYPQEVAG